MTKIEDLDYCPRVKHWSDWDEWKLKKATRNCRFRGDTKNHMRDVEIFGTCFCHAWVPSGLIRYRELKGLSMAIGDCPHYRCVIESLGDSSTSGRSDPKGANGQDASGEPDGSPTRRQSEGEPGLAPAKGSSGGAEEPKGRGSGRAGREGQTWECPICRQVIIIEGDATEVSCGNHTGKESTGIPPSMVLVPPPTLRDFVKPSAPPPVTSLEAHQ